jgi:hypothetical protein
VLERPQPLNAVRLQRLREHVERAGRRRRKLQCLDGHRADVTQNFRQEWRRRNVGNELLLELCEAAAHGSAESVRDRKRRKARLLGAWAAFKLDALDGRLLALRLRID